MTALQAAKVAKKTHATITNWCKRYGIGVKVGGQWNVDPKKLKRMLEGGNEKNK
jgi:hypothetical protein